jgi:hypothetical protein
MPKRVASYSAKPLAPFTAYLLKLASEPNELAAYRSAIYNGTLASYLTTAWPNGPGLSATQAATLQNGADDSTDVVNTAMTELETYSTRQKHPFHGLAITFACEVNNIETGTGSGGGGNGNGNGNGGGGHRKRPPGGPKKKAK